MKNFVLICVVLFVMTGCSRPRPLDYGIPQLTEQANAVRSSCAELQNFLIHGATDQIDQREFITQWQQQSNYLQERIERFINTPSIYETRIVPFIGPTAGWYIASKTQAESLRSEARRLWSSTSISRQSCGTR